jgi:hypothetical protein
MNQALTQEYIVLTVKWEVWLLIAIIVSFKVRGGSQQTALLQTHVLQIQPLTIIISDAIPLV